MELIENLLELFKLQSSKTLTEYGSKADKWWIGMWWKLLFLFGILIADAELKIHGFHSAVSWATLVVPLLALLVLGNPTRQVQFSLIWAVFVHKDKEATFKDRTADGFKEYWTIIGIVILWSVFIPLGIKLIPIEYCPTAFWVFLPTIAAHELAWWRGWHNDRERDFRRHSIAGLKWIIYGCLIAPFLFAAKVMLYEQFGYAPPTPSTSTATINQATHENEILLEARRTECVQQIKERTLGKGIPLSKSDIAAMEDCKTKYASLDTPSIQKESVGGGETRKSSTAAKWYEHPIDWMVQNPITALIVVITHGLVIWWIRRIRNGDTVATETAAVKTVVVEKKKSQGWPFSPVGVLLWALIIWSLVSWFNGGWITSSTDVHRLGDNISTIFDKKEGNPVVKAYPSYFFTQKEIRSWEAVGTFPVYHRHFGEISGRSFHIKTAARSGQRPSIDNKVDGGWGKPLLIELEEKNPGRDVVIEQTNNCSTPLTTDDAMVQTVCTGTWRSGNRSISGEYELMYSANRRIAKLHAVKQGGEVETIVFVFQPKQ